MASLYSAQRAKYGNLTGQIIIWPVEVNPDINSSANKKALPSGYLRCDGSIYNVSDFPRLAEICGVGTTGKFVRRNIDGDPLQSLSDEQFVVPDLGSKYPKPTTGPDAGQYKSVRVVAQNGVEGNRSGVGIEATATLGTTIQLTYSGSFVVSSQTIDLKGKPSWTWGTTEGKRTDSEVVDAQGIHGHMHFGTFKRTRIKASNSEVDINAPGTYLDPTPIGQVAYWNASTVPIDDWLEGTKSSGCNYPGSNQPPCRAMASNAYARGYDFYFGAFAGTFDPTAYGDGCFNGGQILEDAWTYNCLMTTSWNNFPISSSNCSVAGLTPYSSSGTVFAGICTFEGENPLSVSESVNAFYVDGGQGVPLDWKSQSLADVLPLNSNLATDDSRVYATLFNDITETQSIGASPDPTEHFHKVSLDQGTHSFKMVTDALELSPDNLVTTLNLSVDNSSSIDNISMPFIVLEYLIKI